MGKRHTCDAAILRLLRRLRQVWDTRGHAGLDAYLARAIARRTRRGRG